MNKDNFKLIEELGEVYIEPTIKLDALNDLLTYNINQENIYDILIIADFYQYKRMEELIEKIQLLILDGKIKIEYNELKKEDLYKSIYINDCLREGNIKCDLRYKIHDVCCVKYLIEIIGKKVHKYAIYYAAKNGHIETIKYLESKGYKIYDYDAINSAAENGHIEIIKYLESQGYKGNEWAIIYAAGNGYIETIKYLESKGHKGTTWAIHGSAKNGHIETVKYLIEKKYKFTLNAIIDAETQEIQDLLEANKHLMV